jgi:SAM-dependent methyltransferase
MRNNLQDRGQAMAAVDSVVGTPECTATEMTAHGAPHPFKVVSFYTRHNEYEQHAQRLRNSLLDFGVSHELHGIDEFGPWETICARKARFILDCWHASEIAVVWLDADATVEQYPALFGQIDADFAVHKWRGSEFGSGTIYFGKSEPARLLLEQWVLRCEADPVTWDQVHLQSAWCDVASVLPLRTEWLPRSYLQIFDAQQEALPVIKHWQASRALKADGRVTGLPRLHYTELGHHLRRLHEPWRSAETSFWISQGCQHIKPEFGNDFPEGFDVGAVLERAIGGCLPVLEVGCGTGRIAGLFSDHEYVGVDVNPNALLQARAANPKHLFRIADRGLEYPEAPSVLLYTVLLHISDEEIGPFLEATAHGRNRLVISEIMDRRWRRPGIPPVFNRDVEEYVLAMHNLQFDLVEHYKNEYARYAQAPWNVGRDSRLTTLVFDRRSMPRQTRS